MRNFTDLSAARTARPRHQQRRGGRSHLRRLRRRPARQLPRQRAGLRGHGGRGERAPAPPDRPLRRCKFGDHIPLIRRQDMRGCDARASRSGSCGRSASTRCARRAREMEQDAARFYRLAPSARATSRSASCWATSPRRKANTTDRRRARGETPAPTPRQPRTKTRAGASSCRSSSRVSSA